MVGESDALKKVLVDIRKVAPTNATVLIQGETGVGKELAARAVHDASPRAEAPFVAVNCAALPANLVESELFGHERGAFTDARQRRRGRFELADGGTLFLDEITELPLDLQPKLLRVVQQGEFQRVGGSVTHRVDVRMIAASNRDLRAEVKAGRFREDLFYRLNVFPITVPPLRDRVEDIPLLVGHFVPAIAARIGREVDEIPASVMRELVNYTWPGNVRELLNILERSVLTSPDSVLVLPETLHGSDDPVPVDRSGPLLTLEQHEREYVAQILRVTKGQVAGPGGAAEILGVNPSTLRSRLKKLGLSARR
jgi:transcriptional regulator with GAF, ATPase, and Fis domain